MKTTRNSTPHGLCRAASFAAIAVLALPGTGTLPARAADPIEMSKEIIAVQIRKQGFPCTNPQSATRDGEATKYDDAVWILTCDNAAYKVQLIPNISAKVERMPDGQKDDVKSTSP